MLHFLDFKFIIVFVLIDCLDGRFLLIKLKNEDENHARLSSRNEPDGKL